ncbi:MAG: hypothetical protein OSB00_06815 [Sphingomonas bacterium]|nr:hypothetical protein [Sphingomonas bacterium]
MTRFAHHARPLLTGLLFGASTIALASGAGARDVVFATDRTLADQAAGGARVTQTTGVTQIRLDNGAVASFVDAASYAIRADGNIDLLAGSVTVASGGAAATTVHMPDGVAGVIAGEGAAASFTAALDADGKLLASGHVMNGTMRLATAAGTRDFARGAMWRADARGSDRVVAIGAQAAPSADGEAGVVEVADQREGGPLAAAANGSPVALGAALAANGASGDILTAAARIEAAVGNPTLDSFPTGDLTTLATYAARLSRVNGGRAFAGANADIVRAYLGYLADGGARAQFLTVYAGLLTQYLDLLRAGAAPSSFTGTSVARINAFIAFRARTDGFAALSAGNRALVDAYLAFITGGGDPARFGTNATDLVNAYFAFVRGGGLPADFASASQATINDYLVFLRDSGLSARLSNADQALLSAYLTSAAKGGAGFAFVDQYRLALGAYFDYLSAGRAPSGYQAIDAATLRTYLATLRATGLFDSVLGDRATFFAGYLDYLDQGGAIDGYTLLPANIFAGYATALDAFGAYLAAGGVPSAYSAADVALLRSYLATLADAGALDRLSSSNAALFRDYLVFLRGGGGVDAFPALNANIFTGYASALRAYFDYLSAGGVPSGYTALTQAQVTAYLTALGNAGASARFLGDLDSFYRGYFSYVAGGGNVDLYAGLPTPPNFAAFAATLNAYADFLAKGGLPSGYQTVSLTQLADYVKAITAAGRANELLGANATLLTDYFAYIATGAAPDAFANLPVFATYSDALRAYYDYLAKGGVPSAYTVLTQAQVAQYLSALRAAGTLDTRFDSVIAGFLAAYADYLKTGGAPDQFAGLPGQTPTPTPPPGSLAYAGGFNASKTTSITALAYSIKQGGFIIPIQVSTPRSTNAFFQINNHLIDADGGFAGIKTNNGTIVIDRGTAKNLDVLGNSTILIGRWSDGTIVDGLGGPKGFNTLTANQGMHYFLSSGVSGDPVLPTGLVNYSLLAATSPTTGGGTVAPGTFDAKLAIAFGADPKVGVEGTIVFTGEKGFTYAFTTPGGTASPSQSFGFPAITFISERATTSHGYTGILRASGEFADKNARQLGFSYTVELTAPAGFNGETIAGAAIFGTDAIPPAPTPTPAPPTTAAPITGPVDNQTTYYLNYARVDQAFRAQASYDANGKLETFANRLGSTNRRQDAAVPAGESGSIAGAIGWARWVASGGSGNAGTHIVSGTPAVALPSGGRIDYTLIGATKPTDGDGKLAPGTLTGRVAVDVAARKIGVDLDIAAGSYGWNMKTRGGVDDLSTGATIFSDVSFRTDAPVITGKTANACLGSCTGTIQGFLTGPGANYVGLAYGLIDQAAALNMSGVATFAASGAPRP